MDHKRWLSLIGMLLMLASGAGCDTLNIGGGNPTRGPVLTVTVPANMGAEATWTVSWTGGTAPYAVSWNFGGGAEPNEVTLPNAVSPSSTTVTMRNPSLTANSNYIYTVTVTDAQGLSGTKSAAYTVGPIEAWADPVIESAVFDTATRDLTVTVSDADEFQTLVVSVTVPGNLHVDAMSKVAPQTSPRTVVFHWGITDLFATNASGTSTVTVEDDTGRSSSEDVFIDCQNTPLGADTLLAIPLVTAATTDDEVTVVVAMTPPAYAFQYMNGCGVTVESAAEYVPRSFDCGVPDNNADADDPVDGVWAMMNPSGGFLLAPDSFIQATDIGGGLNRWDFNVSPIAGSELFTAQGALFNFRLSFSAPGVYHLGFQQYLGVPRTYYTGADSIPRYWGDITNDHEGIPNSITVTEP